MIILVKMSSREVLINIALGIVIASIIISLAYTYFSVYHIRSTGLTASTSSFGEVGSNKSYKSSYPIQEAIYQDKSILLIYLNASANNVKLTIKPFNITIYYRDGRRISYTNQVFLSSEFTISSDENTLIAAIIVYEGTISVLHIDGYYKADNGVARSFSLNWNVNLDIHPGRTITVYLTMNY
jgi:hypothetical protein